MISENMNENKDDLLASAWNDKLTEDYVDQWGELLLHKKIPGFCQISPSERVLDIGCGSGAAVRAIATYLTTGEVIGIDPTPKMIEIASKLTVNESYSKHIKFLVAGAEKIPVDNESCDLVIAVNSLHHWVNVNDGLKEVSRVLKPSGRFVSIDDLWEESTEYSSEHNDENETFACQHELKTRIGIVNLLKGMGFKSISNTEHREPEATASIITGYKNTHV